VAGTEFLRSEVGAVLTVLAIVVTVAVLSFVLYIGREEYGIARQEVADGCDPSCAQSE
jgi:hypothetical protein